MDLSLFDFDLPEDRIALRPVKPPSAAKLLVVEPDLPSPFHTFKIADLATLLRAGDCLVFNNTKVLAARLDGWRDRPGGQGAAISINLIKQTGLWTWDAFAKPARRLKPGDRIDFNKRDEFAASERTLSATVLGKTDAGLVELEFSSCFDNFIDALDQFGVMPLPPYIAGRRAADAQDDDDYQSIFAERDGAVAAPTASLHIDECGLDALSAVGVDHNFVTLHVGAGTFLPVKTDNADDHVMHSEWGEISQETVDQLRKVKANGGRVIAVGTTALRILETAAWNRAFSAFSGDTDIFIKPGFDFQVADMLLTNFHLPKSTLFMLVSAFSGLEVMQKAYRHAVENEYRFFSYGDACLLTRRK